MDDTGGGNIRHPCRSEGMAGHWPGLLALWQPCSDLHLPGRLGPEFPFSTKPDGTALLLLLLKERWVKRPACEEQEGRGILKGGVSFRKLSKAQLPPHYVSLKNNSKYGSFLWNWCYEADCRVRCWMFNPTHCELIGLLVEFGWG